jgi:5-methylcytosine-specific restriction endonuclease McrA
MNYFEIQPYKTILVLSSGYMPINFTSWKRAVVLILKEKAQVLSSRVIRLVENIYIPYQNFSVTKPSRTMIYKRDRNKCQYCGSTKKLTIDHVIPRSKGGGDTWENMVVACSSCNVRKGDKLLEHTNMKLVRQPKSHYNGLMLSILDTNDPEWMNYAF